MAMQTTEYGQARKAAATALMNKITEQVEINDHPDAIRVLAEAYALVTGTYTGGPKVDVKS